MVGLQYDTIRSSCCSPVDIQQYECFSNLQYGVPQGFVGSRVLKAQAAMVVVAAVIPWWGALAQRACGVVFRYPHHREVGVIESYDFCTLFCGKTSRELKKSGFLH